jgi:hypothetical protein
MYYQRTKCGQFKSLKDKLEADKMARFVFGTFILLAILSGFAN